MFRLPRRRADTRQAAPPDYAAQCDKWQQGDFVRGLTTFVFTHIWEPAVVPDTVGAAIISQTCDVVIASRPHVQLAPIVQLDDENERNQALTGKRPRYIHLPTSGSSHFIDLDTISTVNKSALVGAKVERGATTDDDVRRLAAAIARKFGRFAYPNTVNDCLDPLKELIRSRAGKPNSPIGKVAAHLAQIRVHCPDWNRTPRQLRIDIILNDNVLPDPSLVEEDPPRTQALVAQNAEAKKRSTALAEFLARTDLTATERDWAWTHLADAWAQMCNDEVSRRKVSHEIGAIEIELSTISDYTLTQFVATHELDLDYLSDSRHADT